MRRAGARLFVAALGLAGGEHKGGDGVDAEALEQLRMNLDAGAAIGERTQRFHRGAQAERGAAGFEPAQDHHGAGSRGILGNAFERGLRHRKRHQHVQRRLRGRRLGLGRVALGDVRGVDAGARPGKGIDLGKAAQPRAGLRGTARRIQRLREALTRLRHGGLQAGGVSRYAVGVLRPGGRLGEQPDENQPGRGGADHGMACGKDKTEAPAQQSRLRKIW